MNQGIFGFRKYENASLSYTGIDKHKNESVGGWDTVLRREEYEALYSKQQATMSNFEEMLIPEKYRAVGDGKGSAIKAEIAAGDSLSGGTDDSVEKELEKMLAKVKVGVTVRHQKFGEGVITWIDGAQKYLRVKFSVGEKSFVFPNAFLSGFLEIK